MFCRAEHLIATGQWKLLYWVQVKMFLDSLIFQYLNGLAIQNPWVGFLTVFFAEYLPYVLVGFLFLFFLFRFKQYFKPLAAAFIAGGAAVILAKGIRFIWYRPRPFLESPVNLLLTTVSRGSFPSYHASFFFALSTVILFWNRKLGVLLFIASCLVVVARVFAGLHWPTDILAGMALGIACGLIARLILRKCG